MFWIYGIAFKSIEEGMFISIYSCQRTSEDISYLKNDVKYVSRTSHVIPSFRTLYSNLCTGFHFVKFGELYFIAFIGVIIQKYIVCSCWREYKSKSFTIMCNYYRNNN